MTEAIATVTTNGSGARPKACARATAIGANNAVVAASDMNCVMTATTPKRTSNIAKLGQLPIALCNQPASSVAVPLFCIATPNGIAPAMKTKMRESIDS